MKKFKEEKSLIITKLFIFVAIVCEVALMFLAINPSFDGDKYSVVKMLSEINNNLFWSRPESLELRVIYFITAITTAINVIAGLIMLLIKDCRVFRSVSLFFFLMATVLNSFALGALMISVGLKVTIFSFNFFAMIIGAIIIFFSTRVKIFDKDGKIIV